MAKKSARRKGRVTSKPKRKKGHSVPQFFTTTRRLRWNPRRTLEQNYSTLGLVNDPNKACQKAAEGAETGPQQPAPIESEVVERKPRVEKASEFQAAELRPLLAKYGDDFESMSRDIKLNKWQHSAGQLRKLAKKCRNREAQLQDTGGESR